MTIPSPHVSGPLLVQHFYLRHVRNIELSNVEVASLAADARPSFWLGDVSGVDLPHVKLPRGTRPGYVVNDVSGFRMHANRGFEDISIDGTVFHLKI